MATFSNEDRRAASPMAIAAVAAKQIAKKSASCAQASARPTHAIIEIKASLHAHALEKTERRQPAGFDRGR
jgi:hypothetical protein